MNGSKEQYNDLIARVEMPQALFKELSKLHEMDFKGYYSPAMKELYKRNEDWNSYTRTIREVMLDRSEIESEIRVELMMEDEGNTIKN